MDEVVSLKLPHGLVWVHQDANWNVIGLTDFAGTLVFTRMVAVPEPSTLGWLAAGGIGFLRPRRPRR